MAVGRFPQLLKQAMARARLSGRRLSEVLGYKSDNVISQVLTGRVQVDLELLDAYCQHLGLRGEEREEFCLAAMLECSPLPVGELVRRLQDENEELRGRLGAALPTSRVAESEVGHRRKPGRR